MTILQPGQQLGPYQIISQIGKGGMATIYKAYHANMDRYVALKIVAIGLTEDPNFLKRFQQEARLIARLEHPHILPVHDFGEADGIPYLVMRYLEAGTLKERLAASPLTLTEIDRIFTQLADALTYAHENGVIHRDIKPSNAMLDRRGDIFLTDFGVAKIVEGSSHLTATGTITGTPAYMSPEQAQGQKADQRSDIYSLGIVLFEMLTGRVPFEAETPLAVIFKHIQEPPPPLSVVRPDLPYMLEPVLLRALAKDPAERFASMHEFLDTWKQAYHEAMAWQPTPAAPPAIQPVTPLPAPVLLTPPPLSEPATLSPVLDQSAPASAQKFNWKPIGIGSVVVLALLAAIFLFILRQPSQQSPLSAPTSVPTQATATSFPLVAAPTPTENATSAKPTWTNWIGANNIYSLTTLGDKVYTAGVGGLTIWNKVDGKATQISTRNGLPSAWAVSIFRDSLDDSLWIGTDAGLAHYQNGQVSEVFSSQDGLDSDYITSINRLGDQLLVGTGYCGGAGCGLQTYDGKRWKAVDGFPSADNPTEESVSHNTHSVVVDSTQQIWVGTGDGIAWRDREQKWHVFKTTSGLTDNLVICLFADKDGALWAGTASSGLDRFNPDTQKFETEINLSDYGISDVRSLAMDQNGNLWIGGYNLVRYDLVTKKLTVFSLDDDSLPGRDIYALHVDENNTLFIGTEGSGLLRYDGDGKFTGWTIPNTIDYANYASIVPAPDGRLFFNATYGNGTDIYDPQTDTWAWLTGQPEGGLPLALGTDGTLWYGGGNGVWSVNSSSTIHLTTEHGLPSNQVNQIVAAPDGSVYAATDEGLAVIRNFKVEKTFRPGQAGFMEGRLGPIYAASDNTLFIADEGGATIGHYIPEKGKWAWTDIAATLGVEPVAITSFAEDSEGRFLAGTYGNGLYRTVKDNWEHITIATDSGVQLLNDHIRCIRIAPDGAVWLADYWEGVIRIDGANWTKYSLADGLGSNVVNDIYFAPDGSVWFATDSGVTRLKP